MGRRLTGLVVVTAACAALLSGALPPSSAAVPGAPPEAGPVTSKAYGFTAGSPVLTLSDDVLARQLDASVEAGGRWLRMPMNWLVAEPSRGVFDWTLLDRVVDEARSRGLRVLGVLGGTPAWASSSGSAAAPPDDPADFGAFATAAARHFKGRVRAWEVWNEPNHSSFFRGSAEQYAGLLAQAHDGVTAVLPKATIVLGGLARFAAGRATRPADFLADVYAAGGGADFDVLGLHPYVQAALSQADEATVWDQVAEARAVMRRAGDRRRRVWFTEVGWSTWLAGWSQSRAADSAVALLQRADATRWIGVTVLYTIQDRGSNPSSVYDNYGALLTASGERKELFDRLDPVP